MNRIILEKLFESTLTLEKINDAAEIGRKFEKKLLLFSKQNKNKKKKMFKRISLFSL